LAFADVVPTATPVPEAFALFWAVAITISGTELGAAGRYCDSSIIVTCVPGDDRAMKVILF